jgi:hypothetical protein
MLCVNMLDDKFVIMALCHAQLCGVLKAAIHWELRGLAAATSAMFTHRIAVLVIHCVLGGLLKAQYQCAPGSTHAGRGRCCVVPL